RRTSNPATPFPSTPMCAAQARPARSFGLQKQVAGPKPSRFPRVAGGRPFSANPDDGDLRRFSITSAGPASPARLPVYPWRNGEIIGTGFGVGDEGGVKLLIFGGWVCKFGELVAAYRSLFPRSLSPVIRDLTSVIPALSRDPAAVRRHGERALCGWHTSQQSPRRGRGAAGFL